MASITIKEIENKDEWESFVLAYKNANFLHSWYWGEFHKNLGKKIFRLGIYKDEMLVGVLLMIAEEAKRGKHFLVPAGPLIDWSDIDVVGKVIEEIKNCAKKEKIVFVRVRPQLYNTKENIDLFSKLGFKYAPTHLHAELTSEIQLDKTSDEIFANMRKQTRAEIKKAKNLGIEISSSESPDEMKGFYDREVETANRQGFVPFSYKFLHEQFKVFVGAGCVKLYTAKYEGQILAQAFVIFYGKEAAYHYGVSTEMGRKYPGAYALQWQIIQDAKERGMNTYNLWGVAPIGEKKHRFYPISIFKRGFGGEEREYLHARDLVINPIKYISSYLVEYVRNKRRGL